MGKLKLKRPKTLEERKALEAQKKSMRNIVKTRNSGIFYTNILNLKDNGWVEFVPTCTEHQLIGNRTRMLFPPQEIQYIDPPVETGVKAFIGYALFCAGILGGIIALRRLK